MKNQILLTLLDLYPVRFYTSYQSCIHFNKLPFSDTTSQLCLKYIQKIYIQYSADLSLNPSVPVLIYSGMSENAQSFKREREKIKKEKEREKKSKMLPEGLPV